MLSLAIQWLHHGLRRRFRWKEIVNIANPLFEPLRPTLSQFEPLITPPSLTVLNQILALNEIKFIPQQTKSNNFEDGYEPRAFLKQEVQTRDNCWHDFFNALVWKHFPKSKRMINRLHYQLQRSRYPGKLRLPAENMLTLFDENGAIVIADDDVYLELIHRHRWHELFWQRREQLDQHMKVIVFGHGLYEKALNPYIGLTAQCLMFVANDFSPMSIDQLVAGYLQQNGDQLRTNFLSPLPILGMPGFWEANGDEKFYSNASYFRPQH